MPQRFRNSRSAARIASSVSMMRRALGHGEIHHPLHHERRDEGRTQARTAPRQAMCPGNSVIRPGRAGPGPRQGWQAARVDSAPAAPTPAAPSRRRPEGAGSTSHRAASRILQRTVEQKRAKRGMIVRWLFRRADTRPGSNWANTLRGRGVSRQGARRHKLQHAWQKEPEHGAVGARGDLQPVRPVSAVRDAGEPAAHLFRTVQSRARVPPASAPAHDHRTAHSHSRTHGGAGRSKAR
jgi:hypothetical protein